MVPGFRRTRDHPESKNPFGDTGESPVEPLGKCLIDKLKGALCRDQLTTRRPAANGRAGALRRHHRGVPLLQAGVDRAPWRAIYVQDAERKQTFDEARRTHDAMAAVYRDHGYELAPLPMASVDERIEFIRANC